MDRHVDPNSQSLAWRIDDVLDDTTPGDWIADALPRFEYTVGSLVPPIYTLYSPRVRLPHRDNFLVHGTVRDAVRTLGWCGPNLWWPQDRAWFVATDIDLMSTYIGSSTDCALALAVHPTLEVIDTSNLRTVTWDSDEINPLPPRPYGQ